jgi:hypothetical protein
MLDAVGQRLTLKPHYTELAHMVQTNECKSPVGSPPYGLWLRSPLG